MTITWTFDLQGDLWGVWDETWEGLQRLCREGDQGRPLSPEPQIHSLKEQAKASSTKDPFQHLLLNNSWMFDKQLFMLTNFRQGLTFSLASNHLADRTDPEIRMLRLLHLLVNFSSHHLTGLPHDLHMQNKWCKVPWFVYNLTITWELYRGLLHNPHESNNGGLAQEFTQAEAADAPDTLDWR